MMYFDACSIAKPFRAAPDGPSVTAIAENNANVACLLVGNAEITAAFHRKLHDRP